MVHTANTRIAAAAAAVAVLALAAAAPALAGAGAIAPNRRHRIPAAARILRGHPRLRYGHALRALCRRLHATGAKIWHAVPKAQRAAGAVPLYTRDSRPISPPHIAPR